MKVFILGVGDAFTSVHYNTCFIVQSDDGFNLAIECPHPYMKILHDARKINKAPNVAQITNLLGACLVSTAAKIIGASIDVPAKLTRAISTS